MSRATPDDALQQAGAVFEVAQSAAPKGSDIALADEFSARHVGQVIYVAAWVQWLRWDGCRWAKEDTLAVFDLARGVCRDTSREIGRRNEALAARIASGATVAAVGRLARADRRHARSVDAFDTDPWALNTPGGVVDLRTGQLRLHRPGEMVTKATWVAPGGDCPCWRRFILEIVHGNEEIAAYLQRWAGYILTGEIREHAFLVIIGPGGNGKTCFVNMLCHVMGDYAATAPMETFMATKGDRHSTDLAGLRGARLVVAQETEAGRALAEAKIKNLTGGDPISARFMRGDFFTQRPNFKLVMVGNHRPIIRNPDDALCRRLHLIPTVAKPEKPDAGLLDILKAEATGILQWAIDGCLMWQARGLSAPTEVQAGTAHYFADQGLFAEWVEQRCEADKSKKALSSDLFRDWSAWCDAHGEMPGSVKHFSASMKRHYGKERTGAGVVFRGVQLRPWDKEQS